MTYFSPVQPYVKNTTVTGGTTYTLTFSSLATTCNVFNNTGSGSFVVYVEDVADGITLQHGTELSLPFPCASIIVDNTASGSPTASVTIVAGLVKN